MARGQVLNNNISDTNNDNSNRVDYFVANDKEKRDVMKKVTKSLKQQEKEKIKTKIDTIYGYEDEKYQKMGSRKKNRWINDNFINHPIAREIHYEAQDINTQYPLKSPSPFTKLVNLYKNGINISSFIDINDDRQRLFLKRISKYTNTFINKDNLYKASYGPDNLTRLDRRLKQNLIKKPQYKEVIESYEKNIRLILLKIKKENSKKKHKEDEEATIKKSSKDEKKKNDTKNDLSEKLVKLGKKIKKEKKSEINVFESTISDLNQKYFMISWKIENEFHRLIVHSICRWYGLPSYSKNKEEGRYTFIEINPNEPDLKERLVDTFVNYIYE
jgi:hypothetical protein